VRFLELATRVTGYRVTDAGGFHLRVDVPADAEPQREVIARIVAVIKPAHVTAELSPPAQDAAAPSDQPRSDQPREEPG
jgi:hypothetical protein